MVNCLYWTLRNENNNIIKKVDKNNRTQIQSFRHANTSRPNVTQAQQRHTERKKIFENIPKQN